MVAALRNTVAGGNALPTAQDYPNMPDVFFYDGIENAGFGSHADTPTTWADLIGGRTMGISSPTYANLWESNCFNFNGSCYFSHSGTSSDNLLKSLGGSWTVRTIFEMTYSMIHVPRDAYLGAFGNTSEGSGFGLQCPQSNYNGVSNPASSVFGNYPKSMSPNGVEVINSYFQEGGIYVASLVATPSQYSLYFNGQLYGTSPSGSTSNSTMSKATCYLGATQTGRRWTGRIFGAMGHSRALTAAEIAANYKIDKARFDLP